METKKFIDLIESLSQENRDAIEKIVLSLSPAVEENDWITVSEASEILGVSSQTVRRNIKTGIIPYRNSSQRKTVVSKDTVMKLARYN